MIKAIAAVNHSVFKIR